MGEKVTAKYTLKESFERLSRLCSKREVCEYDLLIKMKLWGIADVDIVVIVSKLKESGFVNNSRYADAFARDKSRFDKWGPVKIKQYLLAKRIDPEIVENAILDLECVVMPDSVVRELNRKMNTIKHKNKYELRNKLIASAVRKGYAFSLAARTVDELLKDQYTED